MTNHFSSLSFWGLLFCLLFSVACPAQVAGPARIADRWTINGENQIGWNVAKDPQLPHQDHIEMSGRQVSAIIRYGAGADRNLTLSREIIWPMLRTTPKPGEQEWAKYRAYLQRTYSAETLPTIIVNGEQITPGPLQSVAIDGTLTFRHQVSAGLVITRTLFPSPGKSVFIEKWEVRNTVSRTARLSVRALQQDESVEGLYGKYLIRVSVAPVRETVLTKGQSVVFSMLFGAFKAKMTLPAIVPANEEKARRAFIKQVTHSLVLATPDSVLNRAFAFAKIRTSESLFATKMGLVHSPGGGRYYGGIWTNDQVEYAGPFFPFLGYAPANEAALNTYRIFARSMKSDYSAMWASFEMEGDFPCCGKDRGDAAMYAYGAAHFSLASGDRKIATELWPAINWALEYNRRRTNAAGVVASETDEMEGRVPTGTANLATSTLAYGALRSAAHLARTLNKPDTATLYDSRADTLRQAIETYFGADIEGFHTYRYFKEHQTLRHWICLPLTMGILERKNGTINALLTKLWTPNGLAIEAGNQQFWDRATLYALRGLFNAGETETAFRYLKEYSQTRLLGEHVPYAVEAYPEGGQAHLAAESALYARVLTEGLFGIQPVGLRAFDCTPHLPKAWAQMRLSHMKAFGQDLDILVSRAGNQLKISIHKDGQVVFEATRPEGNTLRVQL